MSENIDYENQMEESSKERWNEDNWRQEMAKHPLFMTEPVDGSQELPPMMEAMRQLKYDKEFNSNEELVNSYKDDGNENFKHKKYLWAIDSYSEALKISCDNNKLISIVYNNRSSAHFHLKNFRSSLNDAKKALELDSDNNKALIRIVMCYYELNKYSDCIEICRHNSNKNIDLLSEYEKKALIELKKVERNLRKQNSEKLKRKQFEENILKAVNERGIKLKTCLFENTYSAVNGRHVTLNESGELVWPLVFLYPEYGESDFIEQFNENQTFSDHLSVMFNECPVWDTNNKYKPNNIKIGYQSSVSSDIIAININQRLKDVLTNSSYVLMTSIPTFILTAVERKKETKNVKTKVEISLGDCLACSGCITSAESVLITQQSHEELYKIIEANKNNPNETRTIAISLSLQSIASIAAKYGLQMQSAAEKLASFFYNLGVHYIFDISLARHFSLIEAQKEFLDKFKKKEFPVLTSVCPGFVCYAEKTHGELIVPLLSQVKSPQQIMGILIKEFLKEKQIKCNDVYHISIMPCYDKKLEASRNHNEFCDLSDDNVKEVDCVLTPVEIEVVLNRENVILEELDNRKLDSIIPHFNEGLLKSHLGSGSGGYVENLFRFMASKYYNNYYKTGQQLNYKVLRNKDFIDLTLEDESGQKLLSFAVINGFRNIQTLVQRIKRKTCHYQYAEVMACPSGCLNGGAQLRPDSVDDKLFDRVEHLYKSLDITSLPVNCEDETIHDLYDKYFAKHSHSKLYTKFSPVAKNLNLINVNW